MAGVEDGDGGVNRRRSGIPTCPMHHRRNQHADKHYGTTTNLMRKTRGREPHQSGLATAETRAAALTGSRSETSAYGRF